MKVYNYYVLYGTVVMSIHTTKEDAERQKHFLTEYKVVRYPEILTIEPFCPFVSLFGK